MNFLKWFGSLPWRSVVRRKGPLTGWAATGALLAFFCVGAGLWHLETERNEAHLRDVREETWRQVANVRSRAETVINKRVYLTLGLRAIVSANPDVSSEQFGVVASMLQDEVRGAMAFALMKDNAISAVYPQVGSENLIGYTPFDTPQEIATLEEVVQSGQMWLVGPVKLGKKNPAFLSRAPVYVNGFAAGPENYWGMVSILFCSQQIAAEIREGIPGGLEIAIENRLASDVFRGDMFYGDGKILESSPLASILSVQSGSWKLYGVPRGGWPTEAPGQPLRKAIGCIVAAIIACLTYVLIRNTLGYFHSHSELRKASLESHRMRLLFEKTSHMARVGGWEYDVASDRLLWSDEVCEIHDMPHGHVPTLKEAIRFITPEFRPPVEAIVRRRMENRERWDLVMQLRTPKGRLVWVRAVGTPEYEDGKCVRVWGTIQDITERHEEQEQLRLIQHAVDNSADAVLFINQAGEFTYSNFQAASYLQKSQAEMLRSNVFGLERSITRESWPRIWQRVLEAGVESYEAKLVRADGTTLDCEFRSRPVRFAGKELVVATIRDISQAKREAEMRDVLFERSPDAMLIHSEAGFVGCNQAALDMLRLENKADVLGHHPEEFCPDAHESSIPLDEARKIVSQMAYDHGGHQFDWVVRRATGEEFACEVTLRPVELESGPALLTLWHDISERKLVEEKLVASNLELQQFAYVASHDLQAPLRGIASFAHFLAEDYGDKLDGDALEYISRIVAGCKKMQRLVSDLLAYSSLDNFHDSAESIELNDILDEVVSIHQLYLVEAGGRVTRDELPSIVARPSQISQLLENLVGNALKYHGDSPSRVHVSAEVEDGVCTLSVADNGIGIPAECQHRVFEIFKRLHTQEEFPGTGIGLAVCRRIVERHSGRIWVESTLGEGSTFKVVLPLDASQRPAVSPWVYMQERAIDNGVTTIS